MILVCLLVAPPALAAEKPGKPVAWAKIQTLKAGSTIFVTTGGGKTTKAQLLFADETTLFTMRSESAALPPRIKVFLQNVGAEWPAVARGEKDHDWGDLRVSKDGVFGSDEKLCSLAEVIQLTSRRDVTEIARPRSHRAAWIVLGVVGLLLLGAAIGLEPD